MEHFLDTVDTIPKGLGFQHYDLCHILWLLVFVTAAILCSILYRRFDEIKRGIFRKVTAAAIVADEIFKQVCLQIGDNFEFDYLPLHLCSINILLVAIHAFRPTRLLGNFLYTVCIPGAVAALLFPTWTKLPFGNFMHLHSFSVHILLALYPIVLTAGRDIRPDIRQLPKTLGLLTCLAAAVQCVNLSLGTNFMYFMKAPKGNPLYWFETTFGEHLIGYPVLVALVLLVMFAPVSYQSRIHRRTLTRI